MNSSIDAVGGRERSRWRNGLLATLMGTLLSGSLQAAHADEVVVGFATAQSGFMAGYDGDAANMAKLWIDDRNAAGGLLGQQIIVTSADTKSDRIEGARAGQTVVDAGADIVIVTCDYDFGAPAAGVAQRANKVSVFLCAEDPKAGVQGAGAFAFTSSTAAHVQGAGIAGWAAKNLGMKRPYILLDTASEYNKSLCSGFRWALSQLDGVEIVGEDTFVNDDASIQSQITRINGLAEQPDAIVLCSYIPGGASALRQIRAAGIATPILAGSSMDGTYWTDSVPGLSDLFLPVQASVRGDDPRPEVNTMIARYEEKYKAKPFTVYALPIYAFLDLWAKAVEKAGTTDAEAVVPILESYKDAPSFLGPRSFSSDLHIQQNADLLILRYIDRTPKVVDTYRLSQPVPVDVLFKKN